MVGGDGFEPPILFSNVFNTTLIPPRYFLHPYRTPGDTKATAALIYHYSE
jgi:hypothetical protein